MTAAIEKPADEPDHVRLNGVVRSAGQKLSNAPRAETVVIQEVPPQDGDRIRPRRVVEKWSQALGNVLDPGPEVPHDVEQFVGVLVLASGTEGQSLEDDVGAWSASDALPR